MSKTITSGNVAFMDLTDSRKLDVYISSNLPVSQIYDKNSETYIPDWNKTNLQLNASIYLNSKDVTNDFNTSIVWFKKIGTQTKEPIENGVDGAHLTIDDNQLSDSVNIITYICEATYNDNPTNPPTAYTEITFTRVDSGLDAPLVLAEYSIDGTTGWTSTINTAIHKYIRHSYDGGKTWTVAIKMVGEDGTSVRIKGTATSATKVEGTDYYTLVYNANVIIGAELGDSYLYGGNLYVCADSRDGQDYFINVGAIQGPKGNDGLSSYVFIRYATDANGTGMSTSPSGKTYMGVYTSNTNTPPTTANSYTWSKFAGDDAKNIILNASAQVFRVDKTEIISPETITVTAQTFNTSINDWKYSVDGGQTFLNTAPTGVSRNGNIVNIDGSSLGSNSLVIKASDGIYSDTLTVYKVFDGSDGSKGNDGASAPIAFLTNENITFSANESGEIANRAFTTNIVAYSGTTKVTPTIGTITGLPTGMIVGSPTTLGNEIILTFTITNNATLGSELSNDGTITIPITSPVNTNLKLSWSKVNSGATGAMGVGIKSTTVTYGISDSASTQPADTSWQSTIPVVAEGKYLWTRTITDYTDDTIADTVTYTYAKQGVKGDTGLSGSSVTISSIQYQEGESATIAPTGGVWSDSVVTVAEGKYLWTRTMFSDNTIAYGVSKQGISGRGVSNVTEYYLATTASSGVLTSTIGWTTTIQTIDTTKRYLWNYEVVTYTDGTTNTTTPVIIGVFGNTGAAGKGIKSVTEYYLATTLSSGVTTATSGWSTTMQALTATNKYLWNYELITYTDNTTSTINPVIIGVYGDAGVGINSVTVTYGVSTSASTQPTSWQTSIPAVAEGSYLWTRTVTDYTDDTIPDTVTLTYAKQGTKGETGSAGSSVTVSKIEYQAGTSATVAPTGTWSNDVVSVAEGSYLWTKTTFSDNKVAYGVARQGIDGEKGDAGKGISSIVEQYYQSTSATAQSGGSWSATVPTWADGKYIWTRSVITYTDSTTSTTSPICVTGQKGGTGVGISSVDVWYYQSTSATALSGGSWSTTAPTWVDGKYVWTKTITTYTNNTTDETDAVCITGQRGSQGVQGPKGNDGQQYYTWVKYADTPTSGMSDNPDGKVYIGLAYNKTTATESTTYSDYMWSLIKGETGAVGPKGNDGQQYYTWIKYADNASGANMSDSPSGKSYIGLAYNKTTSTESNTASDYTWALFKGDKGNDGVGISSTTVTYGVSDSSSTQPSSWQSTIPTVADGKYLWTRTVIDYTDTSKADTVSYTYAKQGTKGDQGSAGSSVTVTSIQYQEGASATTAPTETWSNSVVSVADGKYLWTKTVFSDGKTAYGVAKQGSSGRGVKSVTEYYLATASSSGVTTSTSGWTTTIQTITVDKKYLWNYEVITYTDDTTSPTTPIIIGVFGNTGSTGATGKGIKSVTEYYLATSSSSGVTTSTTGWTTTMQTLTATNKYLWNYELITYTDDSKVTINPIIIGVYGDKGSQGDKGSDAYTVVLTNESHIFAGNVSSAIAASATTQVLAYKGSTSQSVTIVSVDGKTASTSSTATSIAGLSFACSTLSGTSPTITFTCTTSFVSPSGVIPIVLTVDGVTITKMFTYSIAFKGTTGTAGTAASLVDITPSALYFKSTTGKDGTFTPDYIYLYPRFQTVTYSKWEYSVDGGTTWVAASGANGLTISTYNSIANTLRIAKASTLYTDTVTSISFRCVSSNSSVYDTVSIAKIYDVVDFNIGGRNYILNSANLSVSGLGYSAGSRAEYRTIDVGQSYMNIKNNTEVTISFDLEMTVNTANPTLMVYNSNRLGPKMFVSKSLKFTAAVGETIKQRCSVVTQITDRENPSLTTNTIEFYSTYDTSNWFKISNLKLEIGNKATDWSPAPEDLNNITFQVYAPNGYLLTNELQSLTLQTFAYEGSVEITSGATFQWSHLIDDAWVTIDSATSTTLTVNKADVLKSKSYRCVMTYKSQTYSSTVTVQDKTDTYNSIMCISSNVTNNDCYWVLYTLVYSDTKEIDPLLGPISISAPSSPVSGDYWYAVDSVNATVTLKKYNGTSWEDSTDKQSLSYYWDMIDVGSAQIPLGDSSKVKVISCHDFTSTATFVCEVSSLEDGLLTQSSLSLTDASDPIVSDTEPTATVNGQIWIKPNDNGTYLMFVWDTSVNNWISSDMDTRSKVYTSRPTSYSVGDLWITASDTDHGSYLHGTLLQAQKSNTTYSATDWSPTLRYDQDINDMKNTLNNLSQYVTITSAGLRIGARGTSGELSPFTSLFTSTELSFYQNSEKLLTLANNKLIAPRIEVEDDLVVQGSISLGDLKIIIESNGSFSFAVQK